MTVHGIAIVNTEGHIESFYTPGGTFEDEGPWAQDKTKTVVHVTTEFSDVAEFVSLHYYKDKTWKSRSAAPGSYYTWKNEAWVLDSDALWIEIRADRDSRLYASDWTQLDDCKLSLAKKGEWTEYRQALREVPENNSDVTHVDKVVWPGQPS